MRPDFYSSNSIDYIRVALAIETLAYHDKNYLSKNIQDSAKNSEEIQALLIEAIKLSEEE